MSLNPNPVVYAVKPTVKRRRRHDNGDFLHLTDSLVTSVDVDIDLNATAELDDAIHHNRDIVDSTEVFELIRHLADPEHPLTLEQLHVVRAEHIQVDDRDNHVFVQFTPTIPHCSMATLIGLCLRVKLHRSLPPRFKIDVKIFPGTHASEVEINRQLNDKERVAAALENAQLSGVVTKCIANTDPLDETDDDGNAISLQSTNFDLGVQLAV